MLLLHKHGDMGPGCPHHSPDTLLGPPGLARALHTARGPSGATPAPGWSPQPAGCGVQEGDEGNRASLGACRAATYPRPAARGALGPRQGRQRGQNGG